MTGLTILFGLLVLFLIMGTGSRLFHCGAYSASLGSVTNTDTTWANDGVFGFRNNHPIFTDDLNIIAAYGFGANLTRMRFNNAQAIAYGIPHIWPLGTAAVPPNLPQVMDMRSNPYGLAKNEDIILESSTSAVGPQQITLWLWLAADNWNSRIPTYQWTGTVRATATPAAGSAGGFSTPVNITFERDLRGGVYEIFGVEVFAATGSAFRIRLPDQPNVLGKQFRPGGLVQSAVGNEPWKPQRGEQGGLGPWGRFDTFVPPQLEMFGDPTGGTFELRMQVGWLGEGRGNLGSL